MQFPYQDAVYQFVNQSTSNGYVVALAVICLLQYIAHMHRMRRVREEQQRCRQELDGVSSRLTSERSQRLLSQYENEALREFLTERTGERALRRFLKRLVPDAGTGWSALLRRRDSGWSIVQSLGLSDESVESLHWDARWESKLLRGESLTLQGEALAESILWKSLTPADQARCSRLHVFSVGSIGELDGALVTTELLPPGFDDGSRRTCVAHLVAGISGSLRDRWRLDSQQRRLHITAEMLALRSVADRHFDSPMAMLSELVREVRDKTQSHRAALFVYAHSGADAPQALVRAGEPLEPGVESGWQDFERKLAEFGRGLQQLEHFCGEELDRFGVELLMGAALLVPVIRRGRTVGLLCFSRRNREEFCESQRQLAAWAASLLAEMLPRAVDHALATRQARIDALTGLANRRGFDRAIEDVLRTAADENERCALLLLDLDRFKSINDSHGHQAGDAVLRATAQLVTEAVQQVRADDLVGEAKPLVARYGGEELAVLLPGLGRDGARRIGELIRERIEAAHVEFGGSTLSVTTSIGVAAFPDHAQNVDELIAAADAALYLAKCAGRNRLEVADRVLAISAPQPALASGVA